MQTLVFDTKDKVTQLWSNEPGKSELLFEFFSTPTVKVSDNFYEVMMKRESNDAPSGHTSVPVLRAPIANTNMLIQN